MHLIKVKLLLLFFFVSNLNSWSQIVLNDETLNNSIADQAVILEDSKREVSIEDLINSEDFTFKPIKQALEIIEFTSSRWYIKFKVKNPGNAKRIIFETARPITDHVDLYEVNEKGILKKWINGDYIPFDEKAFPHRKNIFPIIFESGEEKSFYLVLESDGELINLPFIFWEELEFYKTDYRNNIFHGFYFGVLAVVILIFFFFYLILREKTFLYYIIYVFFQLMLQLSLEGFTHQFIFPDSLYLSSLGVLISAAFTVGFAILYASSFLKIKGLSKGWNRYFIFLFSVLGAIVIMSLIPGITHALAYPLINVTSLVASISIIVLIVWLKSKGHKVNNAFFLGFVILIIGAAVFILGNLGILGDARVSELALKFSSGLEVLALSLSMAQRQKELQIDKERLQEQTLTTLENEVKERTQEVHEKSELLELQNKNMLDSIKYALRIQNALLPTENHIKDVIPDSFIIYKPRNIVSGDFYFVENVTSASGDIFSLFAAVDCTGHGVPGAFMSFLANNYLNQSIKRDDINTTGEALNFLNEGIFKSLKIKENNESGVSIRDGMDLTLCGLNHTKNTLYFSGAKNPIQILTMKKNLIHWEGLKKHIKTMVIPEVGDYILIEVRGNRQAIGYGDSFEKVNFKTLELPIFRDDIIYSYTDGFQDQFGGPKDKKYGSKRFKKLLLSIHHLTMEEQKEKLNQEFEEWKGERENLDDVLIMGVRV